MPTDWNAFANEINVGVLQELGTKITVSVPTVIGKTSTGKQITENKTYTGIAVRGKYDSDFITKETVIQAGDVKLVCQFDDKSFEPLDKKNMVAVYGGSKYTIVNSGAVAPADVNIIYVLQARRVN